MDLARELQTKRCGSSVWRDFRQQHGDMELRLSFRQQDSQTVQLVESRDGIGAKVPVFWRER